MKKNMKWHDLRFSEYPKIHRRLYLFSLATWLANIVLIFVNLFVDISALSFLCLFASVVIQGALSGAFSKEEPEIKKRGKKDLLDRVLYASGILAKVGMAVGFFSLISSGGGPEVVDGVYYLVNHGDIVRTISENYFIYLSVCEYLTMFFGILIFTTHMSERIRNMYLSQSEN